jgi:hypothetical protein
MAEILERRNKVSNVGVQELFRESNASTISQTNGLVSCLKYTRERIAPEEANQKDVTQNKNLRQTHYCQHLEWESHRIYHLITNQKLHASSPKMLLID